jgi:hypothetical protein
MPMQRKLRSLQIIKACHHYEEKGAGSYSPTTPAARCAGWRAYYVIRHIFRVARC